MLLIYIECNDEIKHNYKQENRREPKRQKGTRVNETNFFSVKKRVHHANYETTQSTNKNTHSKTVTCHEFKRISGASLKTR